LFGVDRHEYRSKQLQLRKDEEPALLPVGAENLCHQAIFVDDAARAVMPPEAELVQVGDAIWQRA
jgi:hypothetical protein